MSVNKLLLVTACSIFLTPMASQAQLPSCGLRHLDKCRDTNQLIWTKGVTVAIRDFLGNEPGNFLYPSPKSTAADDAIDVLGGPPDDPTTLTNGMKFFTACRAHSCPEKGAIVMQPNGKIVAIGILHFRCGKKIERACDEDNTLTIYVAKSGARPLVITTISDWAKTSVASEYTYPGTHKAILANIEVRVR